MSADQSGRNIIWTDRGLRESPAFRGLTKTALLVLLDFYARRKTDNRGKRTRMLNNGKLIFTYTQAEEMGYSRASFQRALTQLTERGFIDVTFTGAGLYRSASTYALSDRWKHWGTDAFRHRQRNPNGRNKHYGFQPRSSGTRGTIKNVSKNDNGQPPENSSTVFKNDNREMSSVTKNDN